jgi:tetratricopeptide (TPR) repeat protein
VRITAQLIHGPSDKHLWASSYEREMRDVLTLEREVTADIADRVQARITIERKTVQPRPVDTKALDAYLEGNYHLNTNAGPHNEELIKAGEFFQQAINADPNFAPAYVGLAQAHYTVWWESDNDLDVMRRASERALVLDPNSSDAWVELGLVRLADWDWVAAEEQTRRAIILNPNSANGHEFLGQILDALGKSEEGWREHNIAQQLDPNEDHLYLPLRLRGQYDRAIDVLQKMAERRPQDAVVRWELSENYFLKGLYAEWANELGRCMSLFGLPKIADEFTRSFKSSGYKVALRIWARELELMAQNKEAYFPGVLAEEYAALGDKDRAFYWLEQGCNHSHRAVADTILQWVKVDPGFAVLHTDPRFASVLRCMRLPP